MEKLIHWLIGAGNGKVARQREQTRRLHQEEYQRTVARTARHVAALQRARLWPEANVSAWEESVRGGEPWHDGSSDQESG